MAEQKRGAPGMARKRRKMGDRSRKRENVFKELQDTVKGILRVAPAVDQSIIEKLKKLQKQLNQRGAPSVRPPKRERRV